MGKSVTSLRKKIQPLYDPQQLTDSGVPAEELAYIQNYIVLPIELLVKESWNYKKQDEKMGAKLRANMKRIGQVENIHVRELDTGHFAIVNGNHRYDELIALGKKFVVAYNHGQVTYQEAVRRAIETNETRFETDIVELAMRVSELAKEMSMDDLIATMPYSQAEIDELVEMSQFDFNNFSASPPQADDSDPTKKTISFDLPRATYDKWLDVRKKIEASKTISREQVFEFMLTVAASITTSQINSFHKKLESDGQQEND